MFLQLEKGNQKIRIYRDGKIYYYIFGVILFGMLLLFSISYYFSDSPVGMSDILFLVAWSVGVWFQVLGILHGSITLDSTRNVLEYSKSWNLNTPSFTVRSINIDQIKSKCTYHTGGEGGGEGGWFCRLILCMKEGDKYEEKRLAFTFFNRGDCASVAQLIGKFANKPAFDDKGKQIFTPKN